MQRGVFPVAQDFNKRCNTNNALFYWATLGQNDRVVRHLHFDFIIATGAGVFKYWCIHSDIRKQIALYNITKPQAPRKLMLVEYVSYSR